MSDQVKLSIMQNGAEIPFLEGSLNSDYIYEGQRIKISSPSGKITTLLPEITFLRPCGGGYFFHVENADLEGPEYFMLRGKVLWPKECENLRETGGRKEKVNRA